MGFTKQFSLLSVNSDRMPVSMQSWTGRKLVINKWNDLYEWFFFKIKDYGKQWKCALLDSLQNKSNFRNLIIYSVTESRQHFMRLL